MAHTREDLQQGEFPISLCENHPTQTFFLRGISLPAAHMNAVLALVLLARRYYAAFARPGVCAHHPCASVAFFRLTVYRIQMDARTLAPEQVLLRYLLPLAEQKHAAPAPVVPGLACAAALLARSVSVYRLGANGAFPVPVAVHFPVVARLGAEIFVALLA